MQVPELWNEAGNVYVYVHPKGSGRGPCFKVADHVFSPSSILVELLVSEMMTITSHSGGYLEVTPAAGPVSEGHLYLPLGNTDLDRLVAARNLFALLSHQPLVGTAQNPTYFAAILQIAGLLRRFNFCSYDGTSFGESVDVAFDHFLDYSGVADVRRSREKTLEALILAEQMKSWNLYSEAFPHAVGKYEDLLDLKSPLYERISVSTRQRLDRAHLDLANRQANVDIRLEAFEFPSLFSGTASSTSADEYKNVKFKEWRSSFGKMRSFVLAYYKGLFGNWPPKARSKKNYFSQSGLNRQCLKILYSDFCALYDLLVDRENITTRVIDQGHDDNDGDFKDVNPTDASISALRKVLGEFDKSSPPVLPPIPFDVPKLPTITSVYEHYNDLPAKKQAKYSKAVQPHELQLILLKSRNIDTDALQIPFLLAYKDYELKEARSTNPADLADLRIGAWLFLYVVIQSLPMLVVDAPGLRYTDGVEDFLCMAPQGNPPWTDDAGLTRKMWYKTNSDNVVELSADVVMYSVEGIYMRSHCWLAAKDWDTNPHPTTTNPSTAAPNDPGQISPLNPPRPVFASMDPFTNPAAGHTHPAGTPPTTSPTHRPSSPGTSAGLGIGGGADSPPQALSTSTSPHLRPRSGSVNPRARQAYRASIAIGLEPLALPGPMPGGPMDRTSRVLSVGSLAAFNYNNGGGFGNGGGGGEYQEYHPQQQSQQPHQHQHQQQEGGGLRMSRSAVNLGVGGGGSGGEFLGPGQHGHGHHHGGRPRKASYGGGQGPPAGFGVPQPPPGGEGGGSTFDDILKGMDGNGKKAKKKLFF